MQYLECIIHLYIILFCKFDKSNTQHFFITAYCFIILFKNSCIATCPLLNAPGDGRISYEPAPLTNGEYGVGAVAMFSCDSDFDLFGSTTRTCQGDHMWDNTESTCQRKYI